MGFTARKSSSGRTPIRDRTTTLGGSQKGGFQKGGFGGCSPVPKTGTRVHSDVPRYQNNGTKVHSHVSRHQKFGTRVHSPKPPL